MPASNIGSLAESLFILRGRGGRGVDIEVDNVLGGWRLVQAVGCVRNLPCLLEPSASKTTVSASHFQYGTSLYTMHVVHFSLIPFHGRGE
jgi:hypothetical protein